MTDQRTARAGKPGASSGRTLPPALLQCYPLGEPPRMALHVLDRPLLLLGRADECAIRVEDQQVSRRHAQLASLDPARGTWRLSDCGSANGVFVDGRAIQEVELVGGELVRIGQVLFRFFREGLALRSTVFDVAATGMIAGPGFARLRRLLDLAADSDLAVLVAGETGTGKELAARHLHQRGGRARGPFVAVNCSALPPELIESELFGHEKGAFTGAVAARPGLVRQASGGTLFLDEVGELPLDCQAKLLRVLQEREVRPVGGSRSFAVDLRLVSATNRPLLPWVDQGRFRADLYARLAELVLPLPPLRDRREDIPLLLRAFLAKHGGAGRTLPVEVVEHLCCQGWPFNIRQLESAVRRALLLAGDRPELGLEHFAEAETLGTPPAPASPRAPTPVPAMASPALAPPPDPAAERLREALRRCQGDPDRAAAELGISRSQLYRRAQKLGVRVGDFRG